MSGTWLGSHYILQPNAEHGGTGLGQGRIDELEPLLVHFEAHVGRVRQPIESDHCRRWLITPNDTVQDGAA